jgi:hypothetical protein
MQRTLLKVVQSYLDRTNGFYVNSIHDTDESQQLAAIAEDVYYKMIQEYPNIAFTMKERTLDSLSDTDRPNYMLIPTNVQKIQESKLYYNVSTDGGLKYKAIKYLTPVAFFEMVNSRGESDNTIIVDGFDDNKMLVTNNQFPSYFTSYNDKHVVFDSYHADYDTTLQESKTKIIVSQEEIFYQADDFIIPVPEHLSETYLDMFLNEALTFIYQQPNALIATRARAARIKLQQDNRILGQGRSKKSFGRRSNLTSYVPRGHGE